MLLLPTLLRPSLGIALAGAVVAVALAWRSPAYPLALAGIPTLLDAILGSNPLPKGGVTLLFAVWIMLGVAFSVIRGDAQAATGALMTAPVVLSVILLTVMVLRLGPSPAEMYGSTKVQLFVADVLVFLVGAVYVGARRGDLRRGLLIIFAVSALGAVLLLFELLTGSARAVVGGRFSIAAQEYPIYLGRSSADGLLIAIWIVLTARAASLRLCSLALMPVLVVAMLAAGSRGPVVAFAFGLLTLIALTAATGRARRRLLLVAAGLVAAVVVVPLVVPSSAIGRALSTLLGSASGLSSNGRSGLWSLAYSTFGAHPLIGLGTGGFSALNTGELYPHNILLESAVELGVLGAIPVAAIIATLLRRLVVLWRTAGREQLDVVVLIALFVSALVNALFSGAIQDNAEVWVWGGLALGLGAQLSYRAPRSPDPRVPAPRLPSYRPGPSRTTEAGA